MYLGSSYVDYIVYVWRLPALVASFVDLLIMIESSTEAYSMVMIGAAFDCATANGV